MTITYRILGTTDDVTDCQRDGCPMTGLRMTYHLAVIEDDDVVGDVYYGSACAAMVTGIPAARIRRKAREADAAAEQEKRDREYNARLILDTYACVADRTDREMRMELIHRFWAHHPGLRRDVAAGTATVNASEAVAAKLAEARAVLPDYAPDMRAHAPQVYFTGDGWTWACKCGRRHTEKPYALRSDAETAAATEHDAQVARGPKAGRRPQI